MLIELRPTGRRDKGDPKHMQWIVDHWFEVSTTVYIERISIASSSVH